MEQLALFDFDHYSSVSYAASDFVRLDINAEAYRYIDGWPECWIGSALLIVGAGYTGKTHMAKIWQDRARAAFVPHQVLNDDCELFSIIDRYDSLVLDMGCEVNTVDMERGILHLLNMTRERGVWLLIVARPEWVDNLRLQDLASRVRSMQTVVAGQGALSYDQVGFVLTKCMSDYQLSLTKNQYRYLSSRMLRDIGAIARFCELTSEYLMQGNKLTRVGLSDILKKLDVEYGAK